MADELSPHELGCWGRMRTVLRNPISQAGVAAALVSVTNIFLFVLFATIAKKPSPYLGIVAYVVAPGFLVLGLLLIFTGILLERRKKAGPEAFYLRIDLHDAAQRSAVISFFSILILFLLVSAAGSYKAFEYTESAPFCGQLCHTAMNPEFTTYRFSPHARVACVDCHVGPGASWYVKSKLSGARQLFAVTFNTFPRPIPTPVHNLRPAQDTCEQCHWPKKFYGAQMKVFTHYSSDENNSMRRVELAIKTGGGDSVTGAPEGIHWHMNVGNRIDYVAADENRQVIPYIRVADPQGRVTEYFANDSKLTRNQIAGAQKHRMDCVDCHNRPTHMYVPPDQAVDESLQAGRLDASLPFIKQRTVALLTASHSTTEIAVREIANGLQGFYETKYSDVAKRKQLEIRNAITETQQIFRRTSFPEMKLNWQTHPDNLGHFYFNGCFRCHDGQHVSADGKVVSKDCNLCHTLLAQTGGPANSTAPASFQHPVDLGDMTQVNCSDCHTGGSGP